MNSIIFKTILLFTLIQIGCRKTNVFNPTRPDPHSFSRPDLAITTHLDLNIRLNFDQKKIQGTASWKIQHNASDRIIFDIMDLTIDSVILSDKNQNTAFAEFYVQTQDSILGDELVIKIHSNTEQLTIHYSTSEDAMALQWLDAELTSSKKYPCLFTQSQSIYARSWIPCQDGPAIRFTYNATVQVPVGMMALMSATNPTQKNKDGIYSFKMEYPIPAYLMALAVGDFSFSPIGARTGVYADSMILSEASWEFADLEKMVNSAESLYGPYAWSRYDVIVLPTGFPFGGMENPRLTFLTPTIIAGDRSLTSLLAHELAHSWSGNLVTNASWQDFWLNEGFTTYFESRIMENLYGKEYADMLSLLGQQDLKKTLKDMADQPGMSKLKLDLWNKDPELSLSDIAYEKGKLLLRYLEERIGREEWDLFLKAYFKHFAFKSNSTEGFLQFFNNHFPQIDIKVLDTMHLFIYQEGIPDFKPGWSTKLFDQVDSIRNLFYQTYDLKKNLTANWSTHEWLHFIRGMDLSKSEEFISALEKQYQLSESKNSELAFAWFIYLIQSGNSMKFKDPINRFLEKTGRRKFVLPLYEALAEHGQMEWANGSFSNFRRHYHPVTIQSIERVLIH
ncbi:MAG: M1 family metallopeptidase [Saprospiraceae bacterium]|nr:M1 family metallopeptidase [Saprospiraceae bacterium]